MIEELTKEEKEKESQIKTELIIKIAKLVKPSLFVCPVCAIKPKISKDIKPKSYDTREELAVHLDEHWYIELKDVTYGDYLVKLGWRIERA